MAAVQTILQSGAPVAAGVRHQSVPVPLYLATTLFYLLLIPEQANFSPGGVMLTPYRLFLIPIFFYLLRVALRGSFRFAWPDVAVSLACFWIALASYISSGSFEDALIMGGAHLMDIALPYFVARFAIRTPRDFRIFLILIAPGVASMGLVVLTESLTGRHLIQPFLAMLTGNPSKLGPEFRLGLMRGAASFPHPILAGICLASFLPLYLMSGLRGWPKWIGVIGSVGSFFTMSSAALLGLAAGMMLRAYDWLTQRVLNLNWRIFLVAVSILYSAVELTSKSGFFNVLVRYASLNTVSAYNRVLIWRYGSENVARNPWFGIGYTDWDRPSWMQWDTSFSIDHFWLLLAVRFGVPVTLFLLLTAFGAVVMIAARSPTHGPHDAQLMRGVAISLAVFALGAFSVALWLNALVWFFTLCGIAVSLASLSRQAIPFRPAAPSVGYSVQLRGQF